MTSDSKPKAISGSAITAGLSNLAPFAWGAAISRERQGDGQPRREPSTGDGWELNMHLTGGYANVRVRDWFVYDAGLIACHRQAELRPSARPPSRDPGEACEMQRGR